MKPHPYRCNASTRGPIALPILVPYDHKKAVSMLKVVEAYRKIGDPEDRFDVEFWQAQGDRAIFQAALELASPDFRELLSLFRD